MSWRDQLEQEIYARQLQAASVMENIRMRQSLTGVNGTGRGGNPERLPEKLLAAARQLARKGSLTATDLGHILRTERENARALLVRLENIGLATSELHHDTGIRIFFFRKPENRAA